LILRESYFRPATIGIHGPERRQTAGSAIPFVLVVMGCVRTADQNVSVPTDHIAPKSPAIADFMKSQLLPLAD
jgi:hypothetical protein